MCGVGGAILTSPLCCPYGLVPLQSTCLLSPVKEEIDWDVSKAKILQGNI